MPELQENNAGWWIFFVGLFDSAFIVHNLTLTHLDQHAEEARLSRSLGEGAGYEIAAHTSLMSSTHLLHLHIVLVSLLALTLLIPVVLVAQLLHLGLHRVSLWQKCINYIPFPYVYTVARRPSSCSNSFAFANVCSCPHDRELTLAQTHTRLKGTRGAGWG